MAIQFLGMTHQIQIGNGNGYQIIVKFLKVDPNGERGHLEENLITILMVQTDQI